MQDLATPVGGRRCVIRHHTPALHPHGRGIVRKVKTYDDAVVLGAPCLPWFVIAPEGRVGNSKRGSPLFAGPRAE
eukprot:8688876-Lingulodinium_polyedra.AAC.1